MTNDEEADRLVRQIAQDWRQAGLGTSDQALCSYADKLTRTPHAITDADVATLRRHGFDDRAIHDATQVVAYFNYINRIADALDVDMEEFVQPWEQQRSDQSSRNG